MDEQVGNGFPGTERRAATRVGRLTVRREERFRRRRRVALVLAILVIVALTNGVTQIIGGFNDRRGQAVADDSVPSRTGPTSAAAQPKPTPSTTTAKPKPSTTTKAPASPAGTPWVERDGPLLASDKTGVERVDRLFSDLMSPKSVVASRDGQIYAQNMMYHHSVSVFDAAGESKGTIPDTVDLSQFGVEGHAGESKGAPVEMAFSADGRTAWVSNYSMYGAGFGPEGSDSCTPDDNTSESFLYKIDTASQEVKAVVRVGAVPKYVAMTPNGKYVLVTNWCTWDLSVVDAGKAQEVARIPLGGRYPRGIAPAGDNRNVFVALMGSDRIVKVDLTTKAVTTFAEPGDGPRHLNISPDHKYLYVSNNGSGTVVKIDASTGRKLASVKTGKQPRSMAISADGGALYVVNYESSTMSKVRASDMKVIDTAQTDYHPIGITYEPTKRAVWVACYGGSLIVYDDTGPLG